jgi:CRP/FNR family transcriptional regulator, anaerobic regulatory protein
MPSINQLESGTMYSHTAVSTSRSPTVPLSPHAEPSPTLKDLFRGQPTETLAAGTALFWEGDKAGQVFDVLEGVMRIYRIMSDGRRAIMGFIHPGDVLGVSFQDRYLFTA